MFKKIQFTCWACHRRSWYSVNNGSMVLFTKFVRGHRISFFELHCPKCHATGCVRDKNPIQFLFVKKIRIVSRIQYFGVLSSQLLLGGARMDFKPPTINSLVNSSAEHRHNNRNIIK